MISFDTNIAVHAANVDSGHHGAARDFLKSLSERQDVVVCELMLVELYMKLRNSAIFATPLPAKDAVQICEAYRNNLAWTLVESASVMDQVWQLAGQKYFAIRRIVDVRFGLTLQHFGVTEFATTNLKDFEGLGFERVWNPLLPLSS